MNQCVIWDTTWEGGAVSVQVGSGGVRSEGGYGGRHAGCWFHSCRGGAVVAVP